MPNKERHSMEATIEENVPRVLAPKVLNRQEFGQRLQALVLKKGWRQSDSARADLLPTALAAAMDEELPAIELRQAAGHPGMAWLRVNRAMSFATAAKIIDLLRADDELRKG